MFKLFLKTPQKILSYKLFALLQSKGGKDKRNGPRWLEIIAAYSQRRGWRPHQLSPDFKNTIGPYIVVKSIMIF